MDLCALGWDAVGAERDPPFDESGLRGLLFLAVGGTAIDLRQPDGSIDRVADQQVPVRGWLRRPRDRAGRPLRLLQPERTPWVTASIAAIVFLGLAGIDHVIEIVRPRDVAPGNTVTLVATSASRSRSSPG